MAKVGNLERMQEELEEEEEELPFQMDSDIGCRLTHHSTTRAAAAELRWSAAAAATSPKRGSSGEDSNSSGGGDGFFRGRSLTADSASGTGVGGGGGLHGVSRSRREDYAFCDLSTSAPSPLFPESPHAGARFCNGDGSLSSLDSSLALPSSARFTSSGSLGSCSSIAGGPKSPSQETKKPASASSMSSSAGLPRILRSSLSRMFVRSRSKTGNSTGDSSEPLATPLSGSDTSSVLDCSLTRQFVSDSVAKGLPIIPFGYPTIAIIEKKFQETKSFIRRNAEIPIEALDSRVCLDLDPPASPNPSEKRVESRMHIPSCRSNALTCPSSSAPSCYYEFSTTDGQKRINELTADIASAVAAQKINNMTAATANQEAEEAMPDVLATADVNHTGGIIQATAAINPRDIRTAAAAAAQPAGQPQNDYCIMAPVAAPIKSSLRPFKKEIQVLSPSPPPLEVETPGDYCLMSVSTAADGLPRLQPVNVAGLAAIETPMDELRLSAAALEDSSQLFRSPAAPALTEGDAYCDMTSGSGPDPKSPPKLTLAGSKSPSMAGLGSLQVPRISTSASLQDFQSDGRTPFGLSHEELMAYRRNYRSNSITDEPNVQSKLTYLQKLTQENLLNKKFRKANRNRGDYTLLDFGQDNGSSGKSANNLATSPSSRGGNGKSKTRHLFRLSK